MADNEKQGIWGALARSALNRPLDYFPRPGKGGDATEAQADRIIPVLGQATGKWSKVTEPTGYELDDALDLAKASLAEVKAQTEYQDAKASRLLTVTSFVGTLAGLLFNVFSANYPFDRLDPLAHRSHIVPAFAYLVFLLFVLSALGGALVTFHATRARFKYSATTAAAKTPPKSFLFYGSIVGVTPRTWADSFVETPVTGASLRDLRLEYLKNYVSESYLVAAKTADKLRFLEPAQSLLSWALRFLLAFAVLFAASALALAPTKPAPNDQKAGARTEESYEQVTGDS
jgi:hypothetical protein